MASTLSSLFCAVGSETTKLSDEDIRQEIFSFLEALGDREDVLLLPPDYTRFHSKAGSLTQMICEYYKYIPSTEPPTSKTLKSDQILISPKIEILPALGTHAPMTKTEIKKMFGTELAGKDPTPFLVHDWRNDVVTIGHAPAEMVKNATHGMVDQPWPAQLNKVVWEKRIHDTNTQTHKPLVLSIGQVVPHEVMGMANFNKNVFVGTGGVEAINLSHFIGAVHGMERMMGRKDNPLREILNYSSKEFLEKELDLWYILTVIGSDPKDDSLCVRGLYIGRDIECYSRACDLSLQVNFTLLDTPVKRCVVYLDEDEFHSTWLGNKAIYRTRMAMDDGGELIILAPGVKQFGEDAQIDKLIRKYGYKGTPYTLKLMEEHEELRDNLSAVAHLIHGSTEGRFSVTYSPGHLTRDEVETAGFAYADIEEMSKRYQRDKLRDGWNTDIDGKHFFFVSNPALGLWAVKSRFEDGDEQRGHDQV
jgi:nickel-dependent lactate racemase